MRRPYRHRPKALFIRSGGIGDFLLSIPLLIEACRRYEEIHLFSRCSYRTFIDDLFIRNLSFYDVDQNFDMIQKLSKSSDIISFWSDPEWIDELRAWGANQIFTPCSRPSRGKHFAEQTFETLGWDIPDKLFQNNWLGNRWSRKSETLWIQPGSGSIQKNKPLSYFIKCALSWIDSDHSRKVVFCFGEADTKLKSELAAHALSKDERVRLISELSLEELKTKLCEQADSYIGNDSGPSHMAAMFGIPTEVCFISTSPKIWKPLGSRVVLSGT